MTTAEVSTTENAVAVAEQGATVAPERASSKKVANPAEAGDRVYQIKK